MAIQTRRYCIECNSRLIINPYKRYKGWYRRHYIYFCLTCGKPKVDGQNRDFFRYVPRPLDNGRRIHNGILTGITS